MNWIYLSPHFDDIALSCGGLVWEQTQRGQTVEVWTICGSAPPAGAPFSAFAQTLHQRWGVGAEAVQTRQAEDRLSCQAMGAGWQHLKLSDCIYRQDKQGRHLYDSEAAIFGAPQPAEVAELAGMLAELLQKSPHDQAELVCPLALGGHTDHQLTRQAAERLGRRLWYYADYPYVLRQPAALAALAQSGWVSHATAISAPGLQAWQASVAAHGSQISSFWPNLAAMQQAIEEYSGASRGCALWQPA